MPPAPDPRAATRSRAIQEVREIYSDLARRPLERNCVRRTTCCRFQLTGEIPHLTAGEALLLAKALRATGRTRLPKRADGGCPLLDHSNSQCMAYADRPFGCRTHFCAAAGGKHPRRHIVDLIHRLEAIDRSLGGDGPHPLPGAMSSALATIA